MDNLDKKEKGITLLDDELLRINEYINSLKSKNKYQFLYNISKVIDSYNFEDVLTIIKEILNNDKLNDVLNSLVNDNKINIIDLREDYKTNTFISIISVYCDFNNIELVSDNYDYNEVFLDQSIDDTTSLYLKEMSKYPLLTWDEEKELFLKFKSGDEKAREKITNSNLRLVLSVVKKYVNRGLPFLDLVQEGNLGLMKSIDKYDVEKGFKFSTYATWWIRQGITRAIGDYGNTIRIPIHVLEKSNKLEKVINSLKISLGQEPTVEEISKEMNCSTEMVLKLLEVLENRNLVSLNSFVNEEEDTELINLVPDKENALEEEIIKDLSKTEILNLIDKAKLKDKEKEVLYFRFGILDDKPLTLEKVSEKYDVTPERIRQIEAKALRKLRPYLRKIVDAENFKSKNNNESFIIYLNEFEKCKILDKFDPSKIGFKFSDNTSMSDWFYDNLTELLDSKNIRYKLIQTQYETYKKTKEEERKEKEKIKREKSFSKLNEFELGKRIIISKNNKGNISTNKTYRPAKKENENYDADLNIKEQKHTINEKKWLENYELAKKYYEEQGNLLIPKRYVVKDENGKCVNLGAWINTQRVAYKKGELSKPKMDLLTKIKMVWEVKNNDEIVSNKWMKNYNLAKTYYDEQGNLLIPYRYVVKGENDKYFNLGIWINKQRVAYKKGELSELKIDLLTKIKIVWEIKNNDEIVPDKWMKNYNLAKTYYEEQGNLLIPKSYVVKDENGKCVNLGAWINTQRLAYKKEKLSETQMDLLGKIKMVWNVKNNDEIVSNKWMKNYNLAKTYYEEQGNLLIPKSYVVKDENDKYVNLDVWIKDQRTAYKKEKLSKPKMDLLTKIKMVWEVKNNDEIVSNKWMKNYNLAKTYYEEQGNLLIPKSYVVKDENGKCVNLGVWIKDQRAAYKKGELSELKMDLLTKIKMVWKVKNNDEIVSNKWMKNYSLAKEYFDKFGDLLIPLRYEVIIDGKTYEIGRWIYIQIKAYYGYYGYKLTTRQIDMLNEIGMQWQLKSNKKEENYGDSKEENYYDDKKTSGVDEKTDFSLKESNNTKIKGELQMKNEETGKQIRDTNEFYSMFNGNVQDVDYIIENLISEKQKDEIRVGFYLEFPYYKVEDINKAFNMLSKNQQSAVLKRHDGDLSNPKNTKRGLLNKSEQNLYWIAKNTIVNKIENGFEEKKLGRPKLADKNKNNETKNEVVEKNELPDIVKNAKTEEKSRKIKFDDNEAYLKLYELFNMPYFLYALSKLDPRDYKVLFLKLNYPEKSLEEIASFSGCSKEQLINSFNNAASTLKEVVDTLIDEAFKISDSEIKSENSYKIG